MEPQGTMRQSRGTTLLLCALLAGVLPALSAGAAADAKKASEEKAKKEREAKAKPSEKKEEKKDASKSDAAKAEEKKADAPASKPVQQTNKASDVKPMPKTTGGVAGGRKQI